MIFIPGIATFIIGVGLQVSGYQNPSLGYTLIGLGGLLLLPQVLLLVTRKRLSNDELATNLSAKKHDDKLTIVIKAIVEAEQITPIGKDLTVYLNDANRLTQINAEELKCILLKLQDEKKLVLKTFPDWLLPAERLTHESADKQILAALEPSRNHFTVILSEKFKKYT